MPRFVGADFDPGLLLTVSPFYHYNRANYESSPDDIPSSATQDRASYYEGGQATLAWIKDRSNFRGGLLASANRMMSYSPSFTTTEANRR